MNSKRCKQLKIIVLVACFSLLTGSLWAGGSKAKSLPLKNSNPIVLSHGILGFDDSEPILGGLVKAWGGMDDYLRDEGAVVITTGKTAIGDSAARAHQERSQLLMWMAANGFQQVNVIAHSQGALDNRYMISNLGMDSKISVLTTVNGVHRGTPVADIALDNLPNWLFGFADVVVDAIGSLIYGDSDQDIKAAASSLSIQGTTAFNAATPNSSNVRYYSYGSKITIPDPIQHPIMFLVQPITAIGGIFYGVGAANDGIVPKSSMKWGQWKGGPDYAFWVTGVDHPQAVNFLSLGELWYDVDGYYLKMAKNAMHNQ